MALLYPSVPDEKMCTLDNGVIGPADVFEAPPFMLDPPSPAAIVPL